jgi:hypothetical protein
MYRNRAPSALGQTERRKGRYVVLFTADGTYLWDILQRRVEYKEPGFDGEGEMWTLSKRMNTKHGAIRLAARREVRRRLEIERKLNAVPNESGSKTSLDYRANVGGI